jgi:hypothetical protein
MKGSIVQAGEGDSLAASRARLIAVGLLDAHLPEAVEHGSSVSV